GDENEINATNNNWFYGVYNQFASGYGTVSTADKQAMKMSEAFDPGVVTTHTAAKAYQKVLEFAGCSHQRDTYDARIVEETSSGKAAFKGLSPYNGVGGDWKSLNYPRPGIIDSQEDLRPQDAAEDWTPWPILNSAVAPLDSDNDGMPDDWEDIRGLDPSDPADKNSLNKEGYTRLEEYLNSLVAHIITEQNQEAVSSLGGPASVSGFILEAFWNTEGLYLHSNRELQKVEIFDISGRKVLQFQGNSHNTSVLPQACYLLKATSTEGETKVIRQAYL
ncbi:MAG: T9SS type A sorting domain-containing protein, partial [Bacteroidales bacterium]|nr:T9SS type A sorting domain-containing protein [Bacteroidales bacterium]